MKTKISVIIPVYNGEDDISISLESLLSQTYPDFEVIIIDDGSTDNTFKIIEDYIKKDKRFKYVHQENKGVAMARNKGLKISRGENICFLDSDDFYEKSFLEKMYNTIVNTNTDVCYCGFTIVTPRGAAKKKSLFVSGGILKEYILGTVAVHTTGWIIKKELLQRHNILFPEGVSWGEDFEFFCEVLALTNNISYVNEYLTNYRFAFKEEQLSSFTLEKCSEDYESIMRIVINKKINKNSNINRALIEYRLSALLTYRLLSAISIKVAKKDIIHCYNTHKKYVNKLTWNNGLRSFKLNFSKLKLQYHLRKISK
ncbi:glycosyltransferase family 2 protein [Sporosarcina sp. BP05]|uniref:glycosyltransferase family 2 protein n=1 Tax=Sporosarcina sp. BP05 TaxID=2758726 RepID=UPI00164847D9|nr:glycosyltransferase family 2 protein [Sporosarcina sp. BP05]